MKELKGRRKGKKKPREVERKSDVSPPKWTISRHSKGEIKKLSWGCRRGGQPLCNDREIGRAGQSIKGPSSITISADDERNPLLVDPF